MELERFVSAAEIDIDELVEAVYREVVLGTPAETLTHFLTQTLELPAAEAAAIVTDQQSRFAAT
jgi:hypothetical protein